MARQRQYTEDTNLTGLDKLTGVNAENGATVNVTLDDLAQFLAETGNSDGTRAGFLYTYLGAYTSLSNLLESNKIRIEYKEDTPSEQYSFSTVESLYFSARSEDGASFEPVRRYLVSGIIKLTNVTTVGDRDYAIYRVQSATRVDNIGDESNTGDFVKLSLTFLGGDGDIGLDKLVISPFGAGASSGSDPDSTDGFYADAGPPSNTLGQAGDVYFDTSAGNYYVKVTDSAWGNPQSLKGEKGDSGGAFTQAGIENVITLDPGQDATASVNVDEDNEIIEFSFGIPQGEKGEQGDPGEQGPKGDPGEFNSAGIGSVTVGGDVDDADVTLTSDVDAGTIQFDFVLPPGAIGPEGPAGVGIDGVTYTPADPAPGQDTSVQFTYEGANVGDPIIVAAGAQGEKGDKGDPGSGTTIQVTGTNYSNTGIEVINITGDGVTLSGTGSTANVVISGGGGSSNVSVNGTELDSPDFIDYDGNDTQVGVKFSVSGQEVQAYISNSDIPTLAPATTTTLGGVIVPDGNGLAVAGDGTLTIGNGDLPVNKLVPSSTNTQVLTTVGGVATWADATGGTNVEANPTDAATEVLSKLEVGDTIYSIPSSSGGTNVVANPGGTGDDLTTISIAGVTYEIPSGGGGSGSTVSINGTEVDSPNFITYESTGGITFQIAEGAVDVVEASINSKFSNTSNAPEGYVLAADGNGDVRWEATDNTLTWVEGNDSYTGIDTIIAGEHVVFTRGTGNDIDRLTVSIDPITGVGTHVNINGENRDQVNIDSNDTEVGGIDVEFNTNTNILTFALGTHGAGNNQLLATNGSGDLHWIDQTEDTGTVVSVNTTEFENVDFRNGVARVGGIDLTTAAQDVMFDISKHGSSADQIFATNSSGDFEWVDKESHTPHDIKVNGTSVSDPDFKDAANGTDDITVGVKFNHSGSDVTAGINSNDLRDATSALTGVVKLGSDTVQSVAPASDTPFSIANRTYFVQVDSQGRLVVNVPWSSQTGNPPTLSDISWNFDPNGAASQNITVMVTTAKMDAADTNYNLTVTSSSGTVVSGDIDNPTDQQHSITINSFTGGTVTAVLTYRFEGESSDQMITKTRTGMLNENTPEQVAFLSSPSGFTINHTNGEVEAFDTGTFDVLTKSQYESEANLEGWTIGTITYAPALNTDGKLEIGAADTSYGLAATATITKSGQTMNNYRLNNDSEGTINRVKSFRSGGITNVGDDTTLTAAQIMDLDTFKDDLITSKTDSPDGYTFMADVKIGGDRQYFAYSSEFPTVNLAMSTQAGFPGLTYTYKGVVAGFHVYVGGSGVVPGAVTTHLILNSE